MSECRSYQQRRPHVLPASLADLRGPGDGSVELPSEVARTGRRTYDLNSPEDRVVMYGQVIINAPDRATLQELLNQTILVAVWPALELPDRARSLWELRFGDLLTAA